MLSREPSKVRPHQTTDNRKALGSFPRGPGMLSVRLQVSDGSGTGTTMHDIEARLREMNLALPEAPAPAANYVPFVRDGDTLWVSGQISQGPDGPITGKLGADLDVAAGADAARACALSLLAQVRAACDGDLGRLARVVKLTAFVNSAPDFTEQPKVVNGASDLMVALLGDGGRHARSAVGAAALPLGVAVEIEGVFALN